MRWMVAVLILAGCSGLPDDGAPVDPGLTCTQLADLGPVDVAIHPALEGDARDVAGRLLATIDQPPGVWLSTFAGGEGIRWEADTPDGHATVWDDLGFVRMQYEGPIATDAAQGRRVLLDLVDEAGLTGLDADVEATLVDGRVTATAKPRLGGATLVDDPFLTDVAIRITGPADEQTLHVPALPDLAAVTPMDFHLAEGHAGAHAACRLGHDVDADNAVRRMSWDGPLSYLMYVDYGGSCTDEHGFERDAQYSRRVLVDSRSGALVEWGDEADRCT